MAVFHQIGNDSANLLFEADLATFRGAILSPVNYGPDDTNSLAARARKELKDFALWLDPQLYVPSSTRGQLRTWSYFPNDIETADLQQRAWWDRVSGDIVAACKAFRPDVICSPASLPRAFSNSYYGLCVSIATDLGRRVAKESMSVAQTVVVSGRELLVEDRPMEVASIVSRTTAEWIYLLIYDEAAPRRESNDSLELEAILKLIAALKDAGLQILVGYASSDMLLWKAAGADAVASGKFFNLRRFNRSRFELPPEGGGQLPYWFEEDLIAFIREADVNRLEREGLLSATSKRNPVGKKILELQRTVPGTAWLGLSWRQFLWWFADCEARLNAGSPQAEELLKAAEENWAKVNAKILLDEPANNGSWVRPWRAALQSYRR